MATVASVFFWSWRKAKQDGHQYLLGICCLNRRGFLWGQRRYGQPECSPWSLLSHCRWVLYSGAHREVILSCLSLSATLDLAVWSTSLEAGVVIVPFETLWTWAAVYECLACLFQVGSKDVTTLSAIKRLVSTVTDTPLLFTRCMSFLACIV